MAITEVVDYRYAILLATPIKCIASAKILIEALQVPKLCRDS